MTTKNSNNESSNARKIASEEGVSRQEIAADISKQMHSRGQSSTDRKTEDFPDQVAKEENLNRMELKRDMAEQMPREKEVTHGLSGRGKAWVIFAVFVAIAVIAWFIYH